LNDALRVSGDTREIGAVKNRALQRPRLEQRLFRQLARGVAGAFGDADPRPGLAVSILVGRDGVTSILESSSPLFRGKKHIMFDDPYHGHRNSSRRGN
jgi:hypothetical protein